jgi:lipoyl(octanoyl) transferase
MIVQDLGMMKYRDAWAVQEEVHARVLAGEEERLLLVEHPPVITFGRRQRPEHVLTSAARLAEMGVEVVESDRGGDVTFHGPGQVVAYPIVRLADHGLSVGGYVRRLQEVVFAILQGEYGMEARLEPGAVGVWVDSPRGVAKICALGVRVRRGVTLHGIALNVTTDLAYFELINPCGLSRPVTSIGEVIEERATSIVEIKVSLARSVASAFSAGRAH